MPRLRKRALSLLAGAGLLFFIGTNVQAGWLFVLAALILGAVAAGWLLPIRATSGVTISRRVPGRVHQGEETLVDLEIVNAGGRGRRGLIVQDPHLDAVNLWVGPIRAGERTDITTLRVAERRGRHGPDRVRLKSSAPFGVAERRRWVPVEGSTLVLPKVESLGALPFIEPAATTDHAIHSAPRRGQGPEYLGIREYRPGDSMRHVHWPSTARTGAVMVREFEQEQTRRLAIVMDTSRDAGRTWTPLDRACSAAASLALAALAQGHGARIVTGSDGDADVLSRADEDEILERLALVEAGNGDGFATMVAELGPALRGVQTAVVVFPTWSANGPEMLPAALERLSEQIPRDRGGAGRGGCARHQPRQPGRGGDRRAGATDARRRGIGLPVARRRDPRRSARAGTAGAVKLEIRKPSGPTEDSIAIRVVVAVAVEVAILAVVTQPGAVEPLTAVAALLLAPLAYLFSYHRRGQANVILKLVLSVALLAALGQFIAEVRLATSVDQARLPLASLFLWVQVLHAFDVPRRRDLAFSMVSSLILMAEAGSLSLSTSFVVFLVPWAVLAGVWLSLSSRPRPDQVTSPISVRRVAPPVKPPRLAPARSVAMTTTAALMAAFLLFLAMPRVPGSLVKAPPFSLAGAPSPVNGFDGSIDNPGLPADPGDGVVDFASGAYPGFSDVVDLRARGQLSDELAFRVRATQAALWRAEVFDTYEGSRWTIEDDETEILPQDGDGSSYMVPPEVVRRNGAYGEGAAHLTQTFYIDTPQPNVLFGPRPRSSEGSKPNSPPSRTGSPSASARASRTNS